jgi:ABC-type amino acid transport substrate-binding protein
MRIVARVLTTGVLAALTLAQESVPQPSRPRDKIVVGLPQPNTVRGTVLVVKGEVAGYAPALIEAAAHEVGLELEFVVLPFHGDPVPALQSGSIDLFGPLG